LPARHWDLPWTPRRSCAPPYTPDLLKKNFIADYPRWEGVIKKTAIKSED